MRSYDGQIFGLISACGGDQLNIQKKKVASPANAAYRYSDNDLKRPMSELPMLADSSARIGSVGQRRQGFAIHDRYKYENSSSIHLRHPGNSANITFLDGHLENQNKGAVTSKNVFQHWILMNDLWQSK